MNLLISDKALDNIEREARKQPRLETGGILAGLRQGENAVITHATGPGPTATHSRYHFIKDTPYLQSVLNLLFEYFGANYLGVWHKHTPDLPQPSAGDMVSARDELADAQVGVEQLILPICTLKDGQVNIIPYIVDRTGCKKIEWQTVPHSDLLIPDLIGSQWYESPSGRSRASEELEQLRQAGITAEVRKTEDSGYNFHLSLDETSSRHLIIICPNDYPVSAPEVTLFDSGSREYRPITSSRLLDWTIDSHVVDVYREVTTQTATL
ncbi:MAG: Mov34/MPN/PAD-1 family protein [Dehalococcoidia bacterium]